MLERLHIVLVGTTHAGNVGATARAMKNMGLSSLRLVDPCRYQSQESLVRASGAGEVIRNALVFDSLAEALGDCTCVYGTSARTRSLEGGVMDVRNAALAIVDEQRSAELGKSAVGSTAVVFGRERSGLSNEELALCDWRLHIPCNPDFSSLNLGSAVQVVAYELRQAVLNYQAPPASPIDESAVRKTDDRLADNSSLELFFQHLQQTLIDIGFLDPQSPRLLMPKLRRYFMQNRPDTSELNILRGILSATQKSRSEDS